MIKRKVIEDSDDDENTEPTPPRPSATGLSDITLSTLVSLDGSPSHEIQEQSADPSTSSTGSYSYPCLHLAIDYEADQFKELLNRELRAAHESLIEPTPKSMHTTLSTYSPSQHRIAISPTASRLKTKRSKTSIEKPKAKKSLKTYGRSCQDVFEFHGGSDGELDITPKIDLSHNAGKCKNNENSKIAPAASRWGSQDEDFTRRPITSSGGDAVLLSNEPKPLETSSAGEKEVSLRSCMPPPASKSSSFDQSQRSRKDPLPTSGPAPLKSSMSDVRLPLVGTYSGTSSTDGASAPTRLSHDNSDEGLCRGLAQSVELQSMRLSEATKRIGLQPTEDPAPSSSASEISPSKIITIKRTTQTKDVSAEPSSHLGSACDLNTSAMVNPVVLLPALTDPEEAQDELSLSIPRAASKSPNKPEKASKRKRIIDDETFDELGSDENAIEVPKEHYQPRPSTRRSGGIDGEVVVPTDFSKKPEAIGKGKRKTKRHKTTAFQELLPKDEDEDEEMKVAPDPRFEIPEKKPAKILAERDQPSMERNGDTEEVRPEAQRESNQAVHSTGQKKRGRPKKVMTNVSEEIAADETEADLAQDVAKTEKPVNLPMSKKSQKKTKTKQTSTPIIDEQDNSDDGAPATEDNPGDLPTNVLNEINGNMAPPMLTTDSSSAKSPTKSNPPPETPRKCTTPAPKGPDKHSPISSGKVAYRVGLSKRARIAPLLRIVRK